MIQVVVQTPPPGIPEVPFDPNFFFGSIAPLIGITVVAIAAVMILRSLFRSPIGEAIAEGMRERRKRRKQWRGLGMEWTEEAAPDEGRVAALEQEVGRLRGEMSELAERLDFAERVLAERRERTLGAGQ